MSQTSGTFSTYDSNRLREEFRDAIYMISPEETPFWSMIDHETVDSKHPEWSIDSLATPVSTNQKIEGDEYSFTAPSATTKLGNYTEIATKAYIITRTDEKASKAGPNSELGRERRKKGLELRQDMEIGLLFNKASVAGTDTAARVSGGFAAWITSNDSRGASGADGGFSSGLVVAATNGTQRAFSKSIMDTVVLNTYVSGGSPTVWMVAPYIKTVFSGFMQSAGTAVVNTSISGDRQVTIYGGASTYVSDFGPLDVMPNRQLARVGATAARNAYLIDTSKVSVGIFDDIFEDKVAKIGDAERRALVCEYTLIMKNEAAHGIAADLFGMTAST